jgi:hypothetical protein
MSIKPVFCLISIILPTVIGATMFSCYYNRKQPKQLKQFKSVYIDLGYV